MSSRTMIWFGVVFALLTSACASTPAKGTLRVTEDTGCCYFEGYQSVLRVTQGDEILLEEVYEGATGPHLLTEMELDEGTYTVANWHLVSAGGGFGGGTDPMDECSTAAAITGGATVELLFSHPLSEPCTVTSA